MPGDRHVGGRPPVEIRCGILTVSDSRGAAEDESGAAIRALLATAGHPVVAYEVVADEVPAIRVALERTVARSDIEAVVVNGGTGLAPRDVTIESIAPLWEKELPGFGELFRSMSHAEIGARAVLSRATAGVIAGKFVAVLPGSPAACRLAVERLILPVLGHVAALLGPTS